MFSLESPYRGDSNKNKQYTIFNITKNHPKFSKGLKNEFEIAVVNELSVFGPLKVYCILSSLLKKIAETQFIENLSTTFTMADTMIVDMLCNGV